MSKKKKKIEIDHPIQVISPFVRAGYDEALYILGNWIIDQEEAGKKCIPTGKITEFIIKEISSKREINADKLIKGFAKEK